MQFLKDLSNLLWDTIRTHPRTTTMVVVITLAVLDALDDLESQRHVVSDPIFAVRACPHRAQLHVGNNAARQHAG